MTRDISLAGSRRSPSQGKGKKIIMTTNSGQAATQDRMDPMVEALFKEMMQTATYSTTAARREDAALAQVLLESLKTTISQASAVSWRSSFWFVKGDGIFPLCWGGEGKCRHLLLMCLSK
jgi:hypothetical protein